MAKRSTINGENQEPAFMAPLRCVGGIVGIIRAHADRIAARHEPIGPRVLAHIAEKLQECYLELWEILVDDQPDGGPSNDPPKSS